MADRTTVHISIPETLREWVDEQASHGGFASAGEYICHVLREERRRLAEDHLEELLLEGQNSPAVTMTDEDWEQLKARVRQRAITERRKKTG